jgi:hypothetical protein
MRRKSASIQGRDPNNLPTRTLRGEKQENSEAGTHNMVSTTIVNDGATREYVVKATKGIVSPLNTRKGEGKATDIVRWEGIDGQNNWQFLARRWPRGVRKLNENQVKQDHLSGGLGETIKHAHHRQRSADF